MAEPPESGAARRVPTGTGNAAPDAASTERAVSELRAQIEDDAAVDRFVDDFLNLLGQRVQRVCTDVAAGRIDEAQVTLLSLQAVGGMLGAETLCSVTDHLQSALAAGVPEPGPLLNQLIAAADVTSQALGRH